MKKLVPFTKEIEFKTMISKVTSISLEHTLRVEKDNLISGYFILEGTYKMTQASQIDEEFSYKIPVDIELDEKYDTSNITLDIDDFTYEVIDEEKMRLNITLCIDNIEEKEVVLPVEDEIKILNIADNYKGKEYIVHVIRKDASGAVVYNKDYRKEIWKTTTANPDLVFTDEGDYEISVSAEDKAGNKKIAENVTFRIDKTAPVLSITGVADSQTTDCTATLSVNEAFPFSYDGSSLGSTDVTATITKKTDGAGTTNIATLNTGNFSSGNPHTATYSFTEDGEYTITFNAKDMVGNTAAAVTKTFKVDKNAPELFVTAVNSKKSNISEYQIVGGASDDSKDYVDMNLEVKETFFATNKVSITVHKDGKDVSSGYFKNFSSSSEVSRGSQRFEDDGVYTVEISAQDAIGNKAKDYSMAFTVDNTPPSVENTEKMEGFAARRNENGDLLLNSKDFSDIKDKGYDAFWTVNDTSVFTASVKLDGIDFVDFSDLTDGYHTMMIEVTDRFRIYGMRIQILRNVHHSKAHHIDPVQKLCLIHLCHLIHQQRLHPLPTARNGLSSSGNMVPVSSALSSS